MMLRRKLKHGKIYRLLALTSYFGRTLEEISPKYLAHEISMLMEYQTKAPRFYQKSLELDKKGGGDPQGEVCAFRTWHYQP